MPLEKESLWDCLLSLYLCCVQATPSLWRTGILLFPLPRGNPWCYHHGNCWPLNLCSVLFAYLYLVLIHKEFVVPQRSIVINTGFLVCTCSHAVGRKMLKKGPSDAWIWGQFRILRQLWLLGTLRDIQAVLVVATWWLPVSWLLSFTFYSVKHEIYSTLFIKHVSRHLEGG